MPQRIWSGLVLLSAAACNDPPPPAPVADFELAERVLTRVDRLLAVLEAQAAAPRAVPGTLAVAAPAVASGPETARIAATADPEMLARLEALERRLSSAPEPRRTASASLAVPPSGAPPLREPVVAALAAQKNTYEGRCSVFGQTHQAILDRFGVPTATDFQDGRVLWRYSTASGGFTLVFHGGVVMSIR